MVDRPVLILAFALVAILSALLGAWWRGSAAPRQDPTTAEPSEIERVRAAVEGTGTALARALDAHRGLSARLRGLGDAARDHAVALRALHRGGVAPRGVKARDDWQPPVELRPTTLRPGALAPWQALDRAFQALLAALDNPDASFAQHAAAYEAVAAATSAIVEGLAHASAVELAAGCSFCRKPRPQLGRLISGPNVYVCDECVALCVEILEEEIGESWRAQAEQRLDREHDDEE